MATILNSRSIDNTNNYCIFTRTYFTWKIVNQNTVTYRIEIYQMRIYQRLKVHFIYLTKSKKKVFTYITRDQAVAPWHQLGPSRFHDCHPAGCAHGRGQILTTTTMFQGRGMGCFGGRESAVSIPSPCRVITSRCTRFVCSFVCLFVRLVGCCVVSVPLVVKRPITSHCTTSLLRLISHPRLIVVKSLRRCVCSRLFPPLLLHDVDINTLPSCPSSTAWWDRLHGSMFVRWRVLFGDVPQNSFKIWEK